MPRKISIDRDQSQQLDPSITWPENGPSNITIEVPESLVDKDGNVKDLKLFHSTLNDALSNIQKPARVREGKGLKPSPTHDYTTTPSSPVMDRLLSPYPGEDWRGTTADVLQGVGDIAAMASLPYMALGGVPAMINVAKGALMSGIGGGLGLGISKLTGQDEQGERLGTNLGAVLGGGSMMSPKVRAGAGGILPGAYEGMAEPSRMPFQGYIPSWMKFGEIGGTAGAAIGHPAEGAALGAVFPGIRGGLRGFIESSKDQPWLPQRSPQIPTMPVQQIRGQLGSPTGFQYSPGGPPSSYSLTPGQPSQIQGGGLVLPNMPPLLSQQTQYNMPPIGPRALLENAAEGRIGGAIPMGPAQENPNITYTGRKYIPTDINKSINIDPSQYKDVTSPTKSEAIKESKFKPVKTTERTTKANVPSEESSKQVQVQVQESKRTEEVKSESAKSEESKSESETKISKVNIEDLYTLRDKYGLQVTPTARLLIHHGVEVETPTKFGLGLGRIGKGKLGIAGIRPNTLQSLGLSKDANEEEIFNKIADMIKSIKDIEEK